MISYDCWEFLEWDVYIYEVCVKSKEDIFINFKDSLYQPQRAI
jgi:hypothetical protein